MWCSSDRTSYYLSVLYLLIYPFSVKTSNSLPKVISMKPWDFFPFYNCWTLYTATQVRNLNVIVQSLVVCVCFGCTTARLSNLFPSCFVQSGNTFKPTPTTLPRQWNVIASACRRRILKILWKAVLVFAEQSQFKHVFTNDRQKSFDSERSVAAPACSHPCCNWSLQSCSRRKRRRHVTGRWRSLIAHSRHKTLENWNVSYENLSLIETQLINAVVVAKQNVRGRLNKVEKSKRR